MIQSVQETGRKFRLRSSDRLRVHFLALARRITSWRRESMDLRSSDGVSIGITSLEEKVGRSVVALNLAAALASQGTTKVLLVETSFGSTSFGRKIPRPGHGLSDLVIGQQPLDGCICGSNIENLFVLPAGQVSATSALDLPFDSLTSVNSELNGSFDYVIYDLPVANETTLCFPIASQLDGILLVNLHSVQELAAQRVLKRFKQLGTEIIGMVLNKV